MKTVISLGLWLMIPIMLIGAPVAAIVLGIEPRAQIAESDRLSGGDLERAASLLMRYDPAQMAPGEITTIIAREDELNAALTAGLADHRSIRGRVAVEASRVRFEVTAELPEFVGMIGRYVNIAASIAPSRRGLDITGFRIGKMELPKSLAAPAMQILLESLLGPGRGAHIIENIQSINISGKTVAIGYRAAGRDARLARSNGRRGAEPILVKLQSTPNGLTLGYNSIDTNAEGSPR